MFSSKVISSVVNVSQDLCLSIRDLISSLSTLEQSKSADAKEVILNKETANAHIINFLFNISYKFKI
jgi:hypothetical protein